MTEQEKDILIEKMLDAPDSLTDEELKAIMLDDELKDICEISSGVRSACLPSPEMDVEQEWRQFSRRIRPASSYWKWTIRVAAIFIGVLIVSAILVKVLDHDRHKEMEPVVVDSGRSVGIGSHRCDEDSVMQSGRSEVVVPDGYVQVETAAVAVPVAGKRSGKTSVKAHIEEEIDVEEYLRQQQAEIDYEIALLNAEIYLDEQDAISEFLSCLDGDPMNEREANIIIE